MIFLYGTLRHLPLLRVVLGRAVETRPATAPDQAVVWAEGQGFPLMLPAPGRSAAGLLIDTESGPGGVDGEVQSRLDFYELGFGYDLAPITVETEDGPVAARAYLPRPGLWQAGADWSLEDWVARLGPETVLAAEAFMALWPATEPERAAERYPQMLQRAASQVRARAEPVPRGPRKGRGTPEILSRSVPYSRFFEVAEADLRFPKFDGSLSRRVNRAAFVSCDAVTVLPYDPARDRVLLVEQFRFGPLMRGDPLPWMLEPIAGRIDGGESPEQAARRESVEEAGLRLDRLIRIGGYYPSPGTLTEFLYSFLALADLPEGFTGPGGLDSEAEDIRVHLLSFDALMQLIDADQGTTGPLILSALELARRRDSLRR
ncbi:NUDIX domain-containing protein [Frigidibacter sp. ROC022]|uniref:NUDIX domain-containing protein n=1 Tax=Frigidibacter sp. ROC022 TaxID=2971796 RepID=UPI00215AC2B2|nr:NUDIX domain-containing protein [Frigidibacter sp. ROC022]MCR8723603.1 NUDIX domain-containing protein [Frigidibacter sp. ROC022]